MSSLLDLMIVAMAVRLMFSRRHPHQVLPASHCSAGVVALLTRQTAICYTGMASADSNTSRRAWPASCGSGPVPAAQAPPPAAPGHGPGPPAWWNGPSRSPRRQRLALYALLVLLGAVYSPPARCCSAVPASSPLHRAVAAPGHRGDRRRAARRPPRPPRAGSRPRRAADLDAQAMALGVALGRTADPARRARPADPCATHWPAAGTARSSAIGCGTWPAAMRCCCSRPRRLQGRQRHVRPPGRRRAARRGRRAGCCGVVGSDATLARLGGDEFAIAARRRHRARRGGRGAKPLARCGCRRVSEWATATLRSRRASALLDEPPTAGARGAARRRPRAVRGQGRRQEPGR